MAEMDGFHGEDEWRCKAGLRGHVMQGLGLIMPRTGTRVNELINPRAFDVPLHTPSQARAAIYKLEAPIFKIVPGEEIEADDHNSLMHRLHGNGAASHEAENKESTVSWLQRCRPWRATAMACSSTTLGQ